MAAYTSRPLPNGNDSTAYRADDLSLALLLCTSLQLSHECNPPSPWGNPSMLLQRCTSNIFLLFTTPIIRSLSLFLSFVDVVSSLSTHGTCLVSFGLLCEDYVFWAHERRRNWSYHGVKGWGPEGVILVFLSFFSFNFLLQLFHL